MKYQNIILIHPMKESPTEEFMYVYEDCIGVQRLNYDLYDANRNDTKNGKAIGWIKSKTERAPMLEEGKWYKIGKRNRACFVMFYKSGAFHYDDDGDFSDPIGVFEFDIICEMKEDEA